MGNQASKVLERSKDRKSRTKDTRRQSTNNGNERSQSLLVLNAAKAMQQQIGNNYDDNASSESLQSSPHQQQKSSPPKQPTSRRPSLTEMFSFGKKKPQEDTREHERYQRQHYLLKSVRKSNTVVPLGDGVTIVDVGTGNGIWALEMASGKPKSQVIGVDLRPLESHEQLKNLKYIDMDITGKWKLDSNSVDFIFQRSMGQIIKKEQWSHVLGEMLRVLKPGGKIELVEADLYSYNRGEYLEIFDKLCENQCIDDGVEFNYTEKIEENLNNNGFSNITHETVEIPVGEWDDNDEQKQFGFMNKDIQKALLKSRKDAYVRDLSITPDDYDAEVKQLLLEYEENKVFQRFNFWVAEKPSSAR